MKTKLIVALSLLALATSCVFVRTTSSQHVFYGDKIKEIRSEGEACAYTLLFGFLTFGNMTVDKAAKDAGITEVAFVEHKTNNFLIFGTSCTIVKGK
jgi:hypothetical protein